MHFEFMKSLLTRVEAVLFIVTLIG